MELREAVARKIYANVHHLMRETGTTAQEAYEAAATSILAIPEIAIALAAQMPDLPPERVGEIMRNLGPSVSTGKRDPV